MSMCVSRWSVAMVVAGAVWLAGCATTAPVPVGNKAELLTNSDKTEVQKRADIRLELAIGYYQQHQMEVALDEIKQALLVFPDFADAYSVRGLIYMDMGQTVLAEDNFLRAIKLVPDNPDFLNNYGWFLCQNGRAQQSVAYFESALRNKAYQSPQKALINAGTCSMKANDAAAAERYFLQALRVDPSNVAANLAIAKLYYGRREYERARFYAGKTIQGEILTADTLWWAIKIERKRGDKKSEISMVNQLRRRYPNSNEYEMYQRGAFDE